MVCEYSKCLLFATVSHEQENFELIDQNESYIKMFLDIIDIRGFQVSSELKNCLILNKMNNLLHSSVTIFFIHSVASGSSKKEFQ